MSDIVDLGMRVDTRGLDQGKRKTDEFARGVESADKKTTKAAASIRKKFLLIGAAVTAAVGTIRTLGGSISVIANFDKSMSSVEAVTNATATEMRAMTAVAKELGSTTEFSASQAADGLRFLGMAGFEASEAVAALPDVLNLATAAAMGLGEAADISSNVMSAFGIAATDAEKAADALAAISSRANTDVRQLGDAMKFVGPVASAVGVSVNDAAAAVGVLSDAGLQGSMAGTGLRRVISSLLNPTDQAKAALEGMGVALEDVNPATTDIVDIVERLAEGGLSAADALTIFGDRGGPAILALTANTPRLRELTTEMQNVEGEAARMAGTMRDNLQGDIDGLRSAVEGLMLAMGDAGLRAIFRGVIQTITGLVRAITETINYSVAWVQTVGQLIEEYTGLGTLIQTVMGWFGNFFEFVIGGNSSMFDSFVQFADGLSQVSAGAVGAVTEVFSALPDALGAIFRNAMAAISNTFTGFINKVIEGVNKLRAIAGREALAAWENEGNSYEEVGLKLGTRIADGWTKGVESAPLLSNGIEAFNDRLKANLEAPVLDVDSSGVGGDDETSTNTNTNTSTNATSTGGGQSAVNEMLEKAKQLYKDTRTDAENYAMEVADLNELLDMGYINQDTYNRALEQVKEQYGSAGEAAQFFQSQAEGVADSMVDLAFNGGSLIDTMRGVAQSIAKAALQAALFGGGPMAGLFGQTPGIGLLSGLIPGMAVGGTARGGLTMVGERGPELVNMPKGAQVTPSERTAQMLKQTSMQKQDLKVNNNIVNVLDPNLVGEFLNTPNGEQQIMNVVQRNNA